MPKKKLDKNQSTLPCDLSFNNKSIPRLAKDPEYWKVAAAKIAKLPTTHRLILGDSRNLEKIPSASVHLIVTSPPYWTLKEYNKTEGQLGYVEDYDRFIEELDKVWRECFRVLIPGGRLVIVVGDVCLSRKKHGRHQVIPLHADLQVRCRQLGFDNLTPIFWYKIANASYEVRGNGNGFLGKPYEPNAVIKNDVEFILMERKPGGYRSPDEQTRLLSLIPKEKHSAWFQQVWSDIPGASTRVHPAPYPEELVERIIRMFSFVGDTVLDPFVGTGTTMVVAMRRGRNSIGVEIDPSYLGIAKKRLSKTIENLGPAHELIIDN